MSRLRMIGAELLGLFVDDWRFTLVTLAWLLLVAVALPMIMADSAWGGPILFLGCLAILVGSTWLAARARIGQR